MRLVHSWLRELVPVDDDVDAIATTLTDLGISIEGIEHVGAGVDGVVTARVVRTVGHPDAEHIHRVIVDTGDGSERNVWCGAFNMSVGDVVPLALPGTAMPDGRVIEAKPILGIASNGMLCSARELGLGTDHTGILLLPAESPLGVPYTEVLGSRSEIVYDADITRNLPDCYGHRGVARQLGARTGVAVTAVAPLEATGEARSVPVEIVAGDRCGRFSATVISGVRVTSSPDWVVSRLEAAGMRSINNIVDASNYVMLECSQPNHAYDLDTLGGGGFRIRLAAEGERMVTLDGVERTVTAADLLICDADDTPVGLAGVMGGLDTEVTETTSTIVLEVAYFDPVGIVATVDRHGLRSEASMRFDRGVDPDGMAATAARFVEVLRHTCGDLVVHAGATDAISPGLPARRTVMTTAAEINRPLGTSLDERQITDLLTPLGFTVAVDGDKLRVEVPTWRSDCELPADLSEEVARQFGYDRVGRTVPNSKVHGSLTPVQQRRRHLRQVLLGMGASEAMPNPFLADGDLRRAMLETPVVRIVNSLVADESVLRTSLRPGMLKAIAFNASHRQPGVSLYEIGHVYPPGDGELPDEHEVMCLALAGREAPAAMGAWREIASAMRLGARVDQSRVPAGMHPTRSATLVVGRDVVGALGEVHPDVLEAFDITERVALVELNLSLLLAAEPKAAKWKPVSRFPSADIDLAFTTPDEITADRVDKAIRQGGAGLVVACSLFDVYRSEGAAARSLAFRVRLQAIDRTLDEAELAATRSKIIAAVTKLGAQLR